MGFCLLTEKHQHTLMASESLLTPTTWKLFPEFFYEVLHSKISKEKSEFAVRADISYRDTKIRFKLIYFECWCFLIWEVCENKITVLIITFIGFSQNYTSNKDECCKESILAPCFMLTLPDIWASAALKADIISCSALSNWKFHLIKMQLLWKHPSSVIFACRRYRKKILVPIYESMYVILKYLLGTLMLLKWKSTNRKCKL